MASQYMLKSGVVMPPVLLSLLSTALGTLNIYFLILMNFRVVLNLKTTLGSCHFKNINFSDTWTREFYSSCMCVCCSLSFINALCFLLLEVLLPPLSLSQCIFFLLWLL